QSYATTRYNLNLDLHWSRLQKAVRRDDASWAIIQDSKTQLDFLINSCWLTIGWTAVWSVALLLRGYHPWVFLAVSLGGPLIARVWYLVAVEQYRAFADLLRTSVDLFRFDLLKDLRLALPADLLDERYLWDELNQVTAYGDQTSNFRFQHPKSP